MLCEAMCDAGGPNQLSETIGNLGLWTRLGIPTKATRFKTHQTVRFFSWHKCLRGNRNDFAALHLQNLLVVFGFSCSFDFYVECATCAGRAVFILFGACNSNPFLPHVPKTPKTVMQTVMQRLLVYQFTWRLMEYWNNPTNPCSYNTSWTLGNNLYLL